MSSEMRVPLADGFPAVTESDWRAAVVRLGANPQARVFSDDGIPLGPIYARRADAVPVVPPRAGSWTGVTRLSAMDGPGLAAEVRDDVAGGASGIELAVAGSVHPLAADVSVPHEVLRTLVELLPRGAQFRIDAGAGSAGLVRSLVSVAARRGVALVAASDPFAVMAVSGQHSSSEEAGELAAAFGSAGARGTVAVADGRIWHAAGASEVQELAIVLASLVEQVRGLAPEAPAQAFERLGIALAADADQFLTTAKFRAMRLLLTRLAELVDADAALASIHGETAWRGMERRDPHMNILSAGGAAFAAVAGGADSITVLPYDALGGPASVQARRLARNTQIMLADESHVGRFVDPGAGSGAIEALTDALAEGAWERFQRVEAAGGLGAELRSGTIQREVAETRNKRPGHADLRDAGTLEFRRIAEARERPAR